MIISNPLTIWLNQWKVPGFCIPGQTKANTIWLTIDDGPSLHINRLMDFLAETNTPALHFFSADKKDRLQQLPEIPAGSAIGLHGYSHCRYNQLTLDELIAEIDQCRQSPLTRYPLFRPWFRSPYGSWRPGLHTLLREAGWKPLYWGFLAGDWVPSFQPEQLQKLSSQWLKPGMIIVLHDKDHQTDRLIQSVEVITRICHEHHFSIGKWT
ncbi:MAG: polysaccharide deacetylase family protein [Bacteroidetes bacterium]|nr:polysaccharide deacetylase family protein [Bacteroidota bacterium]